VSLTLGPFISGFFGALGGATGQYVTHLFQSPFPIWYVGIAISIVGFCLIADKVTSDRKKPPTVKEARNQQPKEELDLIVSKSSHSSPQPERSTAPTTVQEQAPSLTYGKIVVRRSDHKEHGGTYRDSEYLLQIENSTPNTMALNCQASLDLDNNPEIRDHVALWNKNSSDKIPIGHSEFLRLFTVSKFYKGNRPVGTKLLFDKKSNVEGVFDYWQVPYTESLNRQLRVLLQSENAHYPHIGETFNRTVQ
jgi:hypothetical protein